MRLYITGANIINNDRSEDAPSASVSVVGGIWWYPHDLLPYSTKESHPYFTFPDGRKLASSLQLSSGRDALLSSFHIRSGWLLGAWGGLVVLSSDEEADQEMSSGSGERYFFELPTSTLCDTFVAIQRNGSNYNHFLTEVMPSLIAWEKHIHETDGIAIAASSFAVAVLRLAGFAQKFLTVRQPCLMRAINVDVLRLLPAGYLNPALLLELSSRVVRAANCDRSGREVVFLSRARNDSRSLSNMAQVVEVIRCRFPKVDVLVPGDLSVEEQVRRLVNARIVIAPHGAQATNMLWARRLEHFIEISAHAQGNQTFGALTRALGGQIHYCASKPSKPQDHNSNHECDLEGLRGMLRRL